MKSIKQVLGLVATLLLSGGASTVAQSDIRGGWVADVDGTRHIYLFKVTGSDFTGAYCSRCDDAEDISVIRSGHITGDRLSFVLLSQTAGRWREQRVEGLVTANGVVLRGAGPGGTERRLARADRPAPSPPPAAGGRPVPAPYVAPGPPERLTLDTVAGTWISGTGPNAQVFMLSALEGKLVGLACGPCNTPWAMAPIEDGTVEGEHVTFYTAHQDWGAVFAAHGPYRNVLIGTVAKHQMRINSYVEGTAQENRFDFTLIGPIRKK